MLVCILLNRHSALAIKANGLPTINDSYLWKHCKILRLTKNMRIQQGCTNIGANELKKISQWLLSVGD
jgi:ATP-dependent DNA helicase PIF1